MESAFGILAARFRIFKTSIIADITRVENYVLCGCILHNFILKEDGSARYIPHGFADEEDADGNVIPGAYRQDQHSSEGRYYNAGLCLQMELKITRPRF